MELIKNKEVGGERPLFGLKDTRLENITITDGESGIKQCQHMEAANCRFYGKYPWWHVEGALIEDCYFAEGSRSAIWYTNDLVMRRCRIDGPKFFREMNNVELEDVEIMDADETFWKVDGLRLKNVKLHGGTYPFMFSKNIYVDGLESDAKYVFQYCENVEIHNAKIVTKDSFWECENVTIYDSVLDGEYLAWHSKNVRLVNCQLAGEQLLCYADSLGLENCTFDKACDSSRTAPSTRPATVSLSTASSMPISADTSRTSRTLLADTSLPTASALSPSTSMSENPTTAK